MERIFSSMSLLGYAAPETILPQEDSSRLLLFGLFWFALNWRLLFMDLFGLL